MATKTRIMTFNRQEFLRHLFSPDVDYNATEAYRRAYPNCKVGHNRLANRLMSCDVIKQAIAKKEAEIEEKLDLSREKQHKKLQQAYDIAKTAKNAAAMTSAIHEQNKMLGYHRADAPNTEREAAKLERMTDETKRLAQQLALLLTRKRVVSVAVDAPEPAVEAITGQEQAARGAMQAQRLPGQPTGPKHALISGRGGKGKEAG